MKVSFTIYKKPTLRKALITVLCVALGFFSLPTASAKSLPDTTYMILNTNGKQGLTDVKGKVIIPAEYEKLGWSDGGTQVVNGVIGYRENGQWGLLNTSNRKITGPDYGNLFNSGTLILASRKGLFSSRDFYGALNYQGKNVIPFQYHALTHENNRFVAVVRSGREYRYGLLTPTHEVVIPFEFLSIRPLSFTRYAVTNQRGKVAIFSDMGQMITDFELDSISSFTGDYAYLYERGRIGLLDKGGNIVVPVQFKDVRFNSAISTLKYDQWKLIDERNIVSHEFEADTVITLGLNRFQLEMNQMSGIADSAGDWVLDRRFSELGSFKDSVAQVSVGLKKGLIDKQGNVILDIVYDSIFREDEFVYALADGEWSIFDQFGTRRSRFEYQEVRMKEHGLIPVRRLKKWGFMDRFGEEVIHCVYDSVSHVSPDLIHVVFHGEQGIVNKTGDWVILPGTGTITAVRDTSYVRRTPYKYYLRSLNGELVYFTENRLEARSKYLLEYLTDSTFWMIGWDGVRIFEGIVNGIPESVTDDYIIVRKGGGMSLINWQGHELLDSDVFEEIYQPSEEFVKVRINNRYGFVDMNGQLRVANRYEDAQSYREGMAAIRILGKWGFIDKQERLVVQPLYDSVADFSSGNALVLKDGKWGIINKKGKVVTRLEYDRIRPEGKSHFITTLDGKMGLLDENGYVLVSPKYDDLSAPGNGYLIVKRNGKYGISSVNGINTIPFVYDQLLFEPVSGKYLALLRSYWESRE